MILKGIVGTPIKEQLSLEDLIEQYVMYWKNQPSKKEMPIGLKNY